MAKRSVSPNARAVKSIASVTALSTSASNCVCVTVPGTSVRALNKSSGTACAAATARATGSDDSRAGEDDLGAAAANESLESDAKGPGAPALASRESDAGDTNEESTVNGEEESGDANCAARTRS